MPLIVPASTTPLEFPGRTPGRALGGDLTVTLGSVTFGVVDTNGVSLHLAGLNGWWDPPPSTGAVEQRASDHGGWLTPAYSQPRVIEIAARLKGAEWRHLESTIDAIVASIPLSTLEPLYVNDHGTTRVAWVRQEGTPLIARKGNGAQVSLSLLAPDPRKYAAEESTVETGLPQTSGGMSLPLSTPLTVAATVDSGVLVATNTGTWSTRPLLRVYGPAPVVQITHRNSGRTLATRESIAAGRYLELDTDKRTALLDGTAPRRVTGTWFEYEPGDNEVALSATTYNPATRLWSSHRSAWR